ncbi:hypothetical protein [Pseudogemmobacter sonorensis]|uniref:hypothetical protein n=1 Tax=Pseudogemmobacter sonorensis TaxID=2989681 RepID=UPI0036862D0C
MGKGSSSAPAAPDPYETASAEAQVNRLDTYSPAGSGTRYGYTDANGNFVQGVAPEGYQSAVTTVESPWETAIREILQPTSVSLVSQVSDIVNNLPEAATAQDTSALAQQIYDTGYARMAPQFEQENNRLLSNLQARGIPVGAEAFTDAYNTQQQGVNDALQNLTLGATQAASTEQSRLFALDSAERQSAISELMAAMTGSYNPPSNVASGQAASVDYSGLVNQQYQSDLNQYYADQQSRNSTLGTLGSLGGALLTAGKSTRTAKDVGPEVDLDAAAATIMQMPVHLWSYRPESAPEGFGTENHLGPMAEDFRDLTGLGDGTHIAFIDHLGVLTAGLKAALMRIALLEREISGAEVN